MTVFFFWVFWFSERFFYHAVFIMRIDYDCMFEEIMLVVQVLLQLFLTNSIFFFVALFQFFHAVINRSPEIVWRWWWCSHRIAGTSVILFASYSLHAFVFTPQSTCSPCTLCVCVWERYLISIPSQQHGKDHCNMMQKEINQIHGHCLTVVLLLLPYL